MILVTGGLGMIGAHTARALADLGREVVATAHHRAAVPSFLSGRVTVEHLDVTDRDAFHAVTERHGVRDIVHLAGSVPGEDPIGYFRADIAGLLNAFEVARVRGIRRFAVASSLGVYLGHPATPWHEALPLPATESPHPIIAFKKAVEPLTLDGLRGTRVEPVILRIGSVWGPLMDPESPFNPTMPYLNAALRGERPPPVPADDSGDACYAPDAGRAIALLTAAPALRYPIYNVSSGRPRTGRALADAVAAAVPGVHPELLPGGTPGPYLDITRLAEDTGFAPDFDTAAAVAHYVAWRAANPR
ncbi:NAD-dependent epimerase/dehydratase family protein [Dactylosporangium sp. NPDC051541]|uniref:NAD-dependent epimerase/dehydratase family protein n=1 Tax=Dactylosporangium sp. NPDC051541 TaxID=3363977 RepID=UPI0037941B6D